MPLTVIAGQVPLGLSMGNGASYPAMYAISAILLGIFSIGLVTMSKFIRDPGGFFSFVEATFGRRVGNRTRRRAGAGTCDHPSRGDRANRHQHR